MGKARKTLVTASAVSIAMTGISGITAMAKTKSQPYAGQEITVAYASQAPVTKLLNQFTQQTGIKVNWINIGWDALQTKITAAAVANTYFADVTDVDWSRVGQYYRTKWFIPLNKYFNPAQLKSDVPQLPSFTVNGQVIGLPVDASIMTTTINTADFKKARITQNPTTIQQFTDDLKKIQKAGVNAHPLGIPLAAAEGLSTYWYQLTGAFGGSVLDKNYKPLFTGKNSAGYKALAWMVQAYKSGLVPKEMINMTDSQEMQNMMAQHKLSAIFSDYSGDVGSLYDIPSQSKVVKQVQYIDTPGIKGIGPNLGNPDGMGIPTTAKNVGAAVEFLKWFTSQQIQADLSGLIDDKGAIVGFPMRLSSMQMLTKADKAVQGAKMIELFQKHSAPVFPWGPPPWYAQFSNAVYTNIHSAAQGQETVDQAIQAIANQVNQLNQQQ